MDEFCLIVLERTLEMVMDVMPPGENPRAAGCVREIQNYMRLIAAEPDEDHVLQLRRAVSELMTIVQQEGQFYASSRLRAILREIDGTGRAGVA